jgi:hypothetical protein
MRILQGNIFISFMVYEAKFPKIKLGLLVYEFLNYYLEELIIFRVLIDHKLLWVHRSWCLLGLGANMSYNWS